MSDENHDSATSSVRISLFYDRLRRAATISALAIGLVLAAGPAARAGYIITSLGGINGGDSSIADGINASGQIVGLALGGLPNNTFGAFLYSGGTMTSLGTLPGDVSSAAYSINASGQVVGISSNGGSGYFPANVPPALYQAFLYSGGTMTGLGTLGGASSEAYGINNAGQVVGVADTASGHQLAFLYSGGTMTNLGSIAPNSFSVALAINNAGQITGQSTVPSTATNHAFLYSNGTMNDLGTLGGLNSGGNAINASGEVAGYSTLAGDLITHAFLYSNGTTSDLGTLGGNSVANGLNDSGQVVGDSETPNGAETAFLYSGGTMTNLNNLIPADSGWYLVDATAINDSGQIVGWATTTTASMVSC